MCKVQPPVAPAGRSSKDQFAVDLPAGTVRCPAGVTTTIRPAGTGGGMAYFGAACASCPLAAQCTAAKSGRTISVGRFEEQLSRARAAQQDPAWRQDYRATRPKVERKIGHLTRRRHGGRRARVRGQIKIDCGPVAARRCRQPRPTRRAQPGQHRPGQLGSRHRMTAQGAAVTTDSRTGVSAPQTVIRCPTAVRARPSATSARPHTSPQPPSERLRPAIRHQPARRRQRQAGAAWTPPRTSAPASAPGRSRPWRARTAEDSTKPTLALLPPFVVPGRRAAQQLLLLGAVFCLEAAAVYAVVVAVALLARRRLRASPAVTGRVTAAVRVVAAAVVAGGALG